MNPLHLLVFTTTSPQLLRCPQCVAPTCAHLPADRFFAGAIDAPRSRRRVAPFAVAPGSPQTQAA